MRDLQRINRELDAARERDDNRAQVRLITAALALPESQPDRAGYLDELAYAYEKLGRFEEAIDAMRQAVAVGWEGELDDHPSAQALIADLLLRAGRDREADEAWLQAEREDPRNPWVHAAASDAYTRVGLHRKALPWQTTGLQLALAAGEEEGELAWLLTGERGETMDILGLAPDELQLRVEDLIEHQEQQDREYEQDFLRKLNQPRAIAPQQAYIGVAWFPPDQYQRALHTWPSFAEDYEHGPYAAYCARLEVLLRDLRAQGVKRLALTTLRSMTTSPGAPSTTAIQNSPTHERATPRSLSRTTSPTRGPHNETSAAGAAANANTRGAASARNDHPNHRRLTTSNQPKITKLEIQACSSSDQDKPLDFYTNVLDLEKRVENPTPDGPRFLTVDVKGHDFQLVLWPGTPGQAEPAMGRPPASITIETDDIRKTVEELKSRGVEFVSDVIEFRGVYVAQFQDPDGNRLQIREGR